MLACVCRCHHVHTQQSEWMPANVQSSNATAPTEKKHEGKWSKKNVTAAHNILYSHNLSHIMFVPILLVLIFCRRTLAMYYIRRKKASMGGRGRKQKMFRGIRFSPSIFYIERMAFVGTLYLNLISCMCVCASFPCFLLSLCVGRVDERTNKRRKKRYSWDGKTAVVVWDIWEIPYDHDVNIMESKGKKFSSNFFSPSLARSLTLFRVLFCFIWSFFASFDCHLWTAIDIPNVRRPEAFRFVTCSILWFESMVVTASRRVLFQLLFYFLFSILL